MTTLHRIVAALRRWTSGGRAERELHEDVQSYVELRADELRAAGVSDAEARRRARIELGGVAQVEEAVRQSRTGALVEQTLQDVRYALRGLRRAPGFTLTAAISLGLGIGVNIAVFVVANATLLKPLPYDHPNELVVMAHEFKDPSIQSIRVVGLSWAEVQQWRSEQRIFAGVEGVRSAEVMRWREGAADLSVWRLTAGMTALLGVQPTIGRMFTREEADRQASVVVISDAMWTTRFARSPEAVGKMLTLDDRPYEVIGVMPASFRYGPGGNGGASAWLPLAERFDPAVPRSRLTSPIFRLRSGVPIAEANRLAADAGEQMQRLQPSQQPWTPIIQPFDEAHSSSRRAMLQPLTLLLLATTAVLLVVCANMANLLTARTLAREGEMAMRAALGATRSRLARLLFVEVGVIVLIGAGAAAVFAWGALDVALFVMPDRLKASLFTIALPAVDWRVTAFAVGLFVMASLVAGAWPAIRGSRLTARSTRALGASPGRRRMSAVLQAAQIATAVVLVTVAGLFANSLARTLTTDLGFDPHGLTVTIVQLPSRYASADSQHVTFEAILDRVRSVPGVRDAAIGDPPSVGGWAEFVRDSAVDARRTVESLKTIDAAYLNTIGLTLKAGRNVSAEDSVGSEPVVVIDERAARDLFSGESAIGRRIRYTAKIVNPNIVNVDGPPGPWRRIVGVVSPVLGADFTTRRPFGAVYVPRPQNMSRGGALLVRSSGRSSDVTEAVKRAVVSVVPDAMTPSTAALTLPYEEMVAAPRYYAVLVSVFAGLALVTAAVGLYGVLAYAVGQRQREIGVRVALGATLGEIRRLVIADAMRPVIAGLFGGWLVASLTTGYVASFLYGVSPRDPLTFSASGAVLLLTALVATIGPIRKATGVDPIRALRAE